MTATNLLKAVVEEKNVKLRVSETQLEEFARAGLCKRKEQNELKDRKGGYLSIVKLPARQGDAASIAAIRIILDPVAS